MTRATFALLLAGCPSTVPLPPPVERVVDCCEAEDAGDGCRWRPVVYTVPRYTEPFADDARACRAAGFEPYR